MKPRGIAFLIFSLLMIGLISPTYLTAQESVNIQVKAAAPGDPWSILWMRSQNDAFNAIAASTNGLFVAGTTLTLEDIVKQNIILLKYTTEGELLWNQTWTSSFDEAAYALTSTTDAIYLAGKTTSSPYGTNGLLVKLDFNGHQLWNVSFGNFLTEWFTSISVGVDGIYIGGILQKSVPNDVDALIAKFDFDGNELWSEIWDMAAVDRVYGVAASSDGVYLVGDFGGVWDDSSSNAFLAKYSIAGVQMWNSTWGGSQKDLARAVASYNDSVYVTGSTLSFSSSGTGELFLRKYNSTNSLLWEEIQHTGYNHEGIGLYATDDIVFVGTQYEDSVGGYRVNLLDYNATGELNWERAWGGAGNCQPLGYTNGVNGHYFAGTTSEWLTESTNGFLVKFGVDGETTPGPVELQEALFLNPYGSLILSWTTAFTVNDTIDIYELQMDTTPFFNIPDRTWNVNSTSLVFSSLAIGTYYFRVRARDQINLFGPWSNVVAVTITLVPPTLFNPWLAPMALLLGILIIIALILWLFIRRWRIQ
jgi:hypothetical protein